MGAVFFKLLKEVSEEKMPQPILASLVASVSDGVDIWVALRFFYIAYMALGKPGQEKKKTLEQPITKFTLAILVGTAFRALAAFVRIACGRRGVHGGKGRNGDTILCSTVELPTSTSLATTTTQPIVYLAYI